MKEFQNFPRMTPPVPPKPIPATPLLNRVFIVFVFIYFIHIQKHKNYFNASILTQEGARSPGSPLTQVASNFSKLATDLERISTRPRDFVYGGPTGHRNANDDDHSSPQSVQSDFCSASVAVDGRDAKGSSASTADFRRYHFINSKNTLLKL